MVFYEVWRTSSGLIGVNRMTLGDLILVKIKVFILYVILLALLVQVLPILLLGFYVILLLNNRISLEDGEFDVKQRLMTNVLTVIAVIYYLLDFHFGWISFSIFSSTISKESFDSFAIFNMSIGIANILLFFIGNDIFKTAPSMVIRLGIFVLLMYAGIKFGKPVSKYFITNVITQYNDAELTKEREEMIIWDKQNTKTDEEREQDRLEEEKEEADEEQRLRDFDKNYAEKYLN
jgi:hypothetical protein